MGQNPDLASKQLGQEVLLVFILMQMVIIKEPPKGRGEESAKFWEEGVTTWGRVEIKRYAYKLCKMGETS